jgi:hypothetical protein
MFKPSAALILKKTQQYIKDGWVRSRDAIDHAGKPCSPVSKEATAYDLRAALIRSAIVLHAEQGATLDALSTLAGVIGDADLAKWNDDPQRTQREVVAVIDQAIKRVSH